MTRRRKTEPEDDEARDDVADLDVDNDVEADDEDDMDQERGEGWR